MAMVAAMMVLALLAVLSVAGIATSTLEVRIAANDRDAKQAFYLCEAGLEDAKYKIVRGWGVGTGAGTAPTYTFTFDAGTMPDTVKTGGSIGWSAGRWANFTLADQRGLEYRIQTNAAGYSLTTQAPVPADPPESDYARIFYRTGGPLVSDQANGTPGADQVVFTPAPWTDPNPNLWTGFWIRDNANNLFEIGDGLYDGGANTYTLNLVVGSGTPAVGPFDILLARSGVDGANTFTVYSNPLDPGSNPGGPNAVWRSSVPALTFDNDWFLLDAAGTPFEITGTSYENNPDRMVLTLAGAPADADDSIQIVTNPYLVDTATATVDFGSAAGLQVAYGTVSITVTTPAPAQFLVSAVSASFTTGNTKELRLDASLTDGSQTQIGNWRLIR
ncbi:MAG TPA: pilus assembly PilX N-terminal domain-containing protein [Deferrisomatales bacterium]|nr:pilus assembly PilX N-terminal domain-containing protein [Deferrisomatales bacterium]